MQLGQKIVTDLYPDYGTGTIISENKIFDREIFQVFFESVGKIIDIQKDDLKSIDDPFSLFKSGKIASPSEFQLNFLATSIECLASGENALAPANYKIQPLPHQLLALNFVIDQFRPRCLLADEVGLGKTIEAALIMEELRLRNIAKRILIITPAGLTVQWKDELKTKFAEDFSVFDNDTFKSFKQLYGKETNCWLKFDLVITSIDFLKPKKIHSGIPEKELKRREEHNNYVFDHCLNANWDMVIIDEAHKLSKYKTGVESARYKLGKHLSDIVPIFLLLTATPHRGKPAVFQHLLSLIDPYLFRQIEDVNPDNVKKITVRNKKRASIDFQGNLLFKNRLTSMHKITWEDIIDDPEKKLHDAVTEYIIEYYNYAEKENNNIMVFLLILYQRIVSSSSRAIMKSLQKRLGTLQSLQGTARKLQESETTLDEFFEMPGEKQEVIIEKIAPILKNPTLVTKEISIIENCIELAKNAIIGRNDAKLRNLMKIIDDIKLNENDNNVKILIFTEFIETQRYIIESLTQLGYSTSFINGKLSLAEKIHQKKQFMDDTQIMISTDAGGEGINLQFCHVVINYDLPWNPMKIEQRIGRIDRIGQSHDVIVINFLLAGTVEEHVREIIESKLALIKEQFGEDKLHDILSTLDEEFSFDKLFIHSIAKKDASDASLHQISDEIFMKAKEILENDDMLIPFSEMVIDGESGMENFRLMPQKLKSFTELFLINRESELNQYSGDQSLFYFRNNFQTSMLPHRYSNIIFQQDRGLEIEDAELFCYTHPYIQLALVNSRRHGKTSSFIIENEKFSGTNGILFNWSFIITNNTNFTRKYYYPIFIDSNGKFNRRISKYCQSLEKVKLITTDEIGKGKMGESFHAAKKAIDLIAENTLWEVEKDWKMKIQHDNEKMDKFFHQKGNAIAQIKIDNIKLSKQNELRKERIQKHNELKKQSGLFPHLECNQIAWIGFR